MKNRYEFQVIVTDPDGPQVLVDRCVLEAASMRDAAKLYAALFESPNVRTD